MDFTEKRLAASIVVLASLTPAQRVSETGTASAVLGELHERAGVSAGRVYASAVIALAKELGGGTEPWLAFTGRGPGKPPPALELLRPEDTDTPESGWWSVFKAWTGPGQMYTLLTTGETPDNALNTGTKAVTLGVINTAVAGVQAVAAVAGLSLGQLALVGGGAFAAYKLWKKKRK